MAPLPSRSSPAPSAHRRRQAGCRIGCERQRSRQPVQSRADHASRAAARAGQPARNPAGPERLAHQRIAGHDGVAAAHLVRDPGCSQVSGCRRSADRVPTVAAGPGTLRRVGAGSGRVPGNDGNHPGCGDEDEDRGDQAEQSPFDRGTPPSATAGPRCFLKPRCVLKPPSVLKPPCILKPRCVLKPPCFLSRP